MFDMVMRGNMLCVDKSSVERERGGEGNRVCSDLKDSNSICSCIHHFHCCIKHSFLPLLQNVPHPTLFPLTYILFIPCVYIYPCEIMFKIKCKKTTIFSFFLVFFISLSLSPLFLPPNQTNTTM